MGRKKGSKNKVKVEIKKGLGDIVEDVTSATGIKKVVEFFKDGEDCGCDKRKEKLNNLPILKRVYKLDCLTEEQYKEYKQFKDNRTIKLKGNSKASGVLSNQEVKFVRELYANKTNTPIYKGCLNCNAKPFIRMVEVLDALFDTYE